MNGPQATPISVLSGAYLAECPLPETPSPETLTPAERDLFETLPTGTRRRAEWWAGRTAAHRALAATGAQDLSILREDNGAPRLEGPEAERFFVAITHGQTRAFAVATRTDGPRPYIGVDLVDAADQRRIQKMERRVLQPTEPPICTADPRMYLVCWGAREAAAKATRTGMFVFALTGVWVKAIHPEDPSSGRAEVHPEGIDVFYRFLDDGAALVLAGATDDAVRYAQTLAARRSARQKPPAS